MMYEKELETYRAKLPALLVNDAGKYAVIKGEELLGTFSTYEDALQAGYTKYGLTPFLVKQINVTEQVQNFTRALAHH